MEYFRLERGALISGTPSTISSAWFKTLDATYDGRLVVLRGTLLDTEYYEATDGDTFQEVIEDICSQSTAAFTFEYEGTAAWKAYQFYPNGETPIFSPGAELFRLLRQKYLVFATEDGFDGTNNNIFFFCAPQARTTDYTITDQIFTGNDHTENRRLIFTDEDGALHSQGAATLPIHNFGFLPSTSAFPAANPTNLYVGSTSSKLPVHLKYRTGDRVNCNGDGTTLNTILNARVKVTEILDLNSTPAWYQIIEPLVWFSGGSPNADLDIIRRHGFSGPGLYPNQKPTQFSDIEQSTFEPGPRGEGDGSFSKLTTGRFTEILSANENTQQAAFEKIDKHTHDSLYAPIANGVTNGDSHNHVGGDGATLKYTETLSNFLNVVVPASSTRQTAPWKDMLDTTANNIPLLEGGDLTYLTVRLSTAQPASGSLVCTMYINNAATAMVVTIPLSSGSGTYQDTTHTISVNDGDTLRWEVVNNATANSAAITAISTKLTKQTT